MTPQHVRINRDLDPALVIVFHDCHLDDTPYQPGDELVVIGCKVRLGGDSYIGNLQSDGWVRMDPNTSVITKADEKLKLRTIDPLPRFPWTEAQMKEGLERLEQAPFDELPRSMTTTQSFTKEEFMKKYPMRPDEMWKWPDDNKNKMKEPRDYLKLVTRPAIAILLISITLGIIAAVRYFEM